MIETKVVDSARIGYRMVSGTAWPVDVQAIREKGDFRTKPVWGVRTLCNGRASNLSRHRTKRSAIGRMREDSILRGVYATTIHAITGQDLEDLAGIDCRPLSESELDRIEKLGGPLADRWRDIQAENAVSCAKTRLALSVESDTTRGGVYCLVEI